MVIRDGFRECARTILAVFGGLSLAFCLGAVLLLSACAGLSARSTAARYTPGVYEGLGQGFRGPILVAVTVDEAGIADVEILEHREDQTPGCAAMEELLELALDGGSAGLDAVSGATESSAGFLAALEDALAKAHREVVN